MELDDVVLHDGSCKSEVKQEKWIGIAVIGVKLWSCRIDAYKCLKEANRSLRNRLKEEIEK